GYDVAVYDRYVSLSNLHGANRAYIEAEIPHIASLMSDSMDEVIRRSDIIVLGNKSEEFRDALQKLGKGQLLIDLVRVSDELVSDHQQYEGICW
ncbi:MAG: GDP-mannose dehydrogenase, partial [Anaerolineae bacterium]